MIRFLVERPVAVLVSFFALLLLGGAAYWHLPASLLPDTDIPEITVSITAGDYAATEVEQRLAAPLRNRLQQLKGLQQLESRASEGKAVIRLSFEPGTNTSLAFIEVNEKVDMAMNDLPREAERPLVSKASVSNIPVFHLNIRPKDSLASEARFAGLSNFVKEVIRRRLEQLPEIAMVDISGLAEPQLEIIPRLSYLNTLGITPARLVQALNEQDISLGNILVRDGHYQYFLRFNAGLYTTGEIAATPVNIHGRLFRLDELARVQPANAEPKGLFEAGGQRAVNVAIIKQAGAKMGDLKTSFDRLLGQFRQDYPELDFALSQDQTALLDFAVSNLEQDLLLGGVLAFLCMLVFIRKGRPALLIGITIPLSLVISQLGFFLAGLSLNVISLGGLILGLGMIIDNSIVVIDTITRRREAGEETVDAAVNGTVEIIRPLITSVLTNCAVFVPLIFMSGLAGALFYDQAISITIGVLSSVLVAVLLLPVLYVLAYRGLEGSEREIPARVHVTGWYEQGLGITFRFPRATFLLVLLLFGMGYFLFQRLDKQRLPPISRSELEVRIDWNEPLDLRSSEARIATLLRQVMPLLAENSTWAGEQQYVLPEADPLAYTQARLYLKAAPGQRPDTISSRLLAACRQAYPAALIEFAPAPNAFDAVFADRMPSLRIALTAADRPEMPSPHQAQLLREQVQQLLPQARINPVLLHDKLVLRALPEKATLMGVSLGSMNEALTSALKPGFIANFQGAQSLVPIVLVNEPVESVKGMLAQTFVSNNQQVPIRLSELMELRTEQDYRYITAGSGGQYYPLDIETARPGDDLPRLRQLLDGQKQEVTAAYTGSYFENWQLIKEMALILGISVLLLYFILAAQFESLVQPLFILAELPIDISGALLFLWLAGNSLNLMSMIGIIIMCGLIINDSILKIDAINQLRRQGMPLMQAIHQGGHKRLKPIVMISLTSVGALLPTLFMHDMGSELQKPLALALMGGMLVGLFVSLFFVPLLYWLVYREPSRKQP